MIAVVMIIVIVVVHSNDNEGDGDCNVKLSNGVCGVSEGDDGHCNYGNGGGGYGVSNGVCNDNHDSVGYCVSIYIDDVCCNCESSGDLSYDNGGVCKWS